MDEQGDGAGVFEMDLTEGNDPGQGPRIAAIADKGKEPLKTVVEAMDDVELRASDPRLIGQVSCGREKLFETIKTHKDDGQGAQGAHK